MPWYETFGMTETGSDLRVTDADHDELVGTGMMDGYFGDPEATARVMRDGWFRTGDLGRMDTRGRVYYAGRRKDMIRRPRRLRARRQGTAEHIARASVRHGGRHLGRLGWRMSAPFSQPGRDGTG